VGGDRVWCELGAIGLLGIGTPDGGGDTIDLVSGMRAAGAAEAEMIVIAVAGGDRITAIAELIRRNFPHVKIAARAVDRSHAHDLMELGVDTLERETFRAAVTLGRKALIALGHPADASATGHRRQPHHGLSARSSDFVGVFDGGAGNDIYYATSGDVLVESRSTRQWNPFELRRRAGYVMQEVGLFPHMSIEENIATVPRLMGWDESRIAARVKELLELVGLEAAAFAHRRPDQLSGGQRQRVGVARALAGDPPLLLMDEPFGALDPVTRAEMHREFRRIQQLVRKTVVLVTHDMAEAFALGTRVGVLADGVLAIAGDPADVAHSTDPRVRPLLEPLMEATSVFGRKP